MASSSPPPPPDPTRNNPFNSPPSCGTPGRPALRRAKTLSNPESPTTWRREPLLDVTNAVLGSEHWLSHGRLQRVPLDDELHLPTTAPAPFDVAPLLPTPAGASRIPRRSLALRRTRSAVPSLGDSSPFSIDNVPSPLPSDGLNSPTLATRELRPRPRPATAAASIPAPPPVPGAGRRTCSASSGGGSGSSGSGRSLTLPSSTATPSRRRTFGGVGLPAVLEDPATEDTVPTADPSTPGLTPLTRSRARSLEDAETTPGTGENERRLRRRRTTGSAPSSPSISGSGGRRGLR
ncbi:hypothetical protein JCM11641_000551 [Rhodosporidiobolus odoratus]